MNSKIFMLLISSAVSIGLIGTSLYMAADNLIAPKGTLFEAIVLFSIGILIALMITIALSIGQTILVFGEIMQQQANIQKEMNDISKMSSTKGNLNTFISNLLPPGMEAIKITVDEIPDFLSKAEKLVKRKRFEDMNLKELEKELAKAIKTENFERAEQINNAIKLLGKSDNLESPETKD